MDIVFCRYSNNIYVNRLEKGTKKPLIVNIPRVKCLDEVNGSGTKYTIGIENVMKDFFSVLDNKAVKYLGDTIHFQGLANVSKVMVKLPYRYRKFEVDVKTSSGLGTVYDIKKGSEIDITLELKNIWTLEDEEVIRGKKTGKVIVMAGYLWIVKNVIILD